MEFFITIKLTPSLQLSVPHKSQVNEEHYILYGIIRMAKLTLINQITVTAR